MSNFLLPLLLRLSLSLLLSSAVCNKELVSNSFKNYSAVERFVDCGLILVIPSLWTTVSVKYWWEIKNKSDFWLQSNRRR